MTLANKLGKSYSKVQAEVKIKTVLIDLGEVKFDLRVRVPLKKEMEEITNRIVNPSEEKIQAVYDRLVAPIQKTLSEGGEEFLKAINSDKQTITVSENDLIVDGTSVRQVANFSAIEQSRVEEYFHLLVSETGEPVNESYEQITQEFPDFAIKAIIEAIDSAIKPDYKTTKKN